VSLRDAQDAPGNGPGDGQSPAAGPPAGSQTSVRVYAAEAGNPVTFGAPSEAAHNVLNPGG
jgi:hypothetical protein